VLISLQMKARKGLPHMMTGFLGQGGKHAVIPCDLPEKLDDGILESADGEPAYSTLAPLRFSDHGDTCVVEEALPILAGLAGRMGRHRGATVLAVDEALEEMTVLVSMR